MKTYHRPLPSKWNALVRLTYLSVCTAAASAFGQTYTFNAATVTNGTYDWSGGITGGWNTSLGNGSSATVLKYNGLFSGTPSVVSTDDIATGSTVGANSNVYSLNQLQIATTGSVALNINGNALYFAGNSPSISLSTAAGELVTIDNNIILGANTTISGGVGVNTAFDGTLSGTGNLTIASGASVTLGSQTRTISPNTGETYQGTTITNNGTLYFGGTAEFGGGNFNTTAGLVNNGSMDLGYSGIAVTSLTGNGNIFKNSPGGTGSGVTVDYVGATGDTYGGLFNNNGSRLFTLIGPGSFTFGNAAGPTNNANLSLDVLGTGMVSMTELGNYGNSNTTVGNNATLRVTTNTSGIVLGPTTSLLNGGTLWLDPASGASGIVTLSAATTSAQLRYHGETTLKLDRNGNAGLIFAVGSSTLSGVMARGNNGTLIIDPTDGLSGLGSTEQFQVLGTLGTSAPGSNNNIWNPSVVAMDSNGNLDFTTYIASGGSIATATTVGTSADPGFMALSTAATGAYASLFTNYNTGFGTTTNSSLVELSGNQGTVSPSAATAAYALRIDAGTTLALGGHALTLGNGTGSAGLILNGGVISGGTVAFGNAEAIIYASVGDATISANMSGAGGFTKSGAGTLFLTGSDGFTGAALATTVNEGAIDIGTITGGTNSSTSGSMPALQLILQGNGGILQGNGSFTRSIAGSGVTSNYTLVLTTGGFAAHGGTFTVNLSGASAQETWGSTNFLTDGTDQADGVTQVGVFDFGSDTSNGQVDFQNSIALGLANGAYYREVNVTSGAGGDSAKLSGIISDSSGATAAHGLLKTGNGTLILSAANTYTGQTCVVAGSLLIDGSTSGQGSYTVSPLTTAGALLGGTGTIGLAAGQTLTLTGISATQRAIISPGDNSLNVNAAGTGQLVTNGVVYTTGAPALMNALSTGGTGTLNVGTLTIGGNVAGNGYDVFNFLLNGDTASLLNIGGNLTLNGNDTLALTVLGGSQTLISYTLITYSGSLTGIFNTTDLPTGYTIDYGTTGEINVDYSAVPEPRTWLLLGFGLVVLAGRLRRRKA